MNRRTFLKAFGAAAAGTCALALVHPGVAAIPQASPAIFRQALDPNYLREMNILMSRCLTAMWREGDVGYARETALLREWLAWKAGETKEPKWRVRYIPSEEVAA